MTQTTEQLSLGLQLKNAREALNLTIEDVAQKTNLKKNHIDAIENDVFILPNVPPAFVRGYVRNYVRFLRLPEDLVMQANYGEVTIPREVKKAAPIKVSNNQKSQNRWVKILTWLILLCAVGMTLAWWWQEHKKEELSRAEMVSSAEVVNTATSPVQAVETTVQNANPAETTPVAPVAVVNGSAQPVVETAAPAQTAQPTEPVTVTAPVETATPAPAAETAVATTTAENQQPEQQTQVIGNDELRIEISGGQSWVTVRSPKAKRSLAEKLYNDGEVLTFSNNEQYRLTIGAPANVKIYYKGQQIPLKVDGRVARIKLPQ